MNDFIQRLEKALDVQPGELRPNTALADVPTWDSMAIVSFLALADSTYGKAVPPVAVRQCKTVSDLEALVR